MGDAPVDEPGEGHPGVQLDFGFGGHLQVVAAWDEAEGSGWRVVRWQLRGRERALMHWARGQDVPAATGDETAAWTAGVALERRDTPGGRWSTVQRQELTGADPAQFAARLRGWEAGLCDRATKLARRGKRL